MSTRSENPLRARRSLIGRSLRNRKRVRPSFEGLESRELLAAVMSVGDATIFTQLPGLPEGQPRPFLTPSDQAVIRSNIIGDVASLHAPPAIAANGPAASKPVPSNQTWSTMLTRNPSVQQLLTNDQTFILVNSSGQPITTGNGTPVTYNDYYKSINQTPPAPKATFFGRSIQATTTNGVTTYAYATSSPGVLLPPGRISSFAQNASNPNSLGVLSFSTNSVVNNQPDPSTNFGLPNTPFPATPGTLFTLTSTARYLDYRPDAGNPNGSQPVTVQVQTAPGQFQTVASNGLIPYFQYDLPAGLAATNSFAIPNFGDLGVSVMDLGQPSTGPFTNPTGLDANNLQLWDYSDHAATFTWGDAVNGHLFSTMSETSPFSQFTYVPGTSTDDMSLLLRNNLQALNGVNIDTAKLYPDLNAIVITGYAKPDTSGMKVIQDPNVLVKVFYVVYLPTGFTMDSTTVYSTTDGIDYLPGNSPPQVPLFGAAANNIFVKVPKGAGNQPFHFVVAALPDDSKATVQALRDYAFNYITGSTGEFNFDPTSNQVGLTLNVTTQNVDPASTQPGALLVISPLQYDNLSAGTYNALYLPDPALPNSFLSLSTPFGNTRLMRAPTNGTHTSTIAYSLPYNGSLSLFPQGAFISTDPNDSPSASKDDLALEVSLIKNLLNNQDPHDLLTNNGQGDTYVWGQQLAKLTALVPIADQLGLGSERDMLLSMVKSELTIWFSALRVLNNDAPSQVLGYDPHFGVPQFLSYDGTWDALIGYYAGHLADLGLNDFMYQWGYWIKAASIVATYDPSFITGYGPMITMLVQNVANWDRNNTMFPFLRTFDTYAGHSWASGVVAVGDGQNLESISEAINFDSSMIDWGNLLMASAKVQNPSDPTYATGLKIRDTGISLQTFEAASYQEYFLNARNDTFPKLTTVTYGGHTYAVAGYIQRETYEQNPTDYTAWKNEIFASNQFVLKRGTQTFFAGADSKTANNAESHYGITVLPFSPSSLYLDDNPALAQANYDRYIAQQNSVYGNPVPGQKRDLPINYFSVMLAYQALTDPVAALGRWNGIGNFRFDFPPTATPEQLASDNFTKYSLQATLDTYPATFYQLEFFNKYGKVAVDGTNGPVRALGATATAVLDKAPSGSSTTYDRTYIIENVSSNPLAGVTFTDGITVNRIPARSVYATTIKRNSPGGPIVRIVTNTYLIPDLSKASVQPPKGSGTNLFLGYSAPAAPQTATVEPLTLQPQTKAGLVSVTPYQKDPQIQGFQYTYATPFVGNDPAKFFDGSVLPQTNIVSFQLKNVNGTYDPKLDTHFQLYFKAPFGLTETDIQLGVQVRYTNGTGDSAVSYVESYPRLPISSIGGLIVVTDTSLGVIGSVPPLGSGVAAATRSVGKGQIDPNRFFEVFKPEGQNANLVYPSFDPNNPNPPLRNRTAQFSPTSFKLTNGTVTFTVFVARFNNNNPNFKFSNLELQFVAGLPGYAGMRSFLTIPFNDVTIAPPVIEPPVPPATVTRLISPAPNAVIDGQYSTVSMVAAVSSGGRPVREGLVRFIENGGRSLGFAPVVNGVARLDIRQPLLSGNDTITAIYSDPDGHDFASSRSAPVHVEIDTVKTDRNGVQALKPGGQKRFDIEPFGRGYSLGVNVAGLELANHRIPVLFVAPRGGRTPLVKAYNALNGALLGGILAYARNSRGAVSIATADLNGRDLLVTAPGRGLRPVVKVFDAFTGRLLLAINAFNPRFRNGTTVSTFVNPAGTGFVIAAQTRFLGKTYTTFYNGLTGARIGVPLVTRSTRP